VSGSARPSIAARFGWGIALPAALLSAFILVLVLATGQGREWAPAVALFFGIAAIPGTMLANAALLFVGWPRRDLLLAGLVLPAYVAVALAIFVHGRRGDENAGAGMLAPYVGLIEAAHERGINLWVPWAAAMAALVAAAILCERRRGRTLLE